MAKRKLQIERLRAAADRIVAKHGVEGLAVVIECLEALVATRGCSEEERASAMLSRVAVTKPWMLPFATSLARGFVGGAA